MGGPIIPSGTTLNPMQIQRQPYQLLLAPGVTRLQRLRTWFSLSTIRFSKPLKALVKPVPVLAEKCNQDPDINRLLRYARDGFF